MSQAATVDEYPRRRFRPLVGLFVFACLALIAASCGSDDTTSSEPSPDEQADDAETTEPETTSEADSTTDTESAAETDSTTEAEPSAPELTSESVTLRILMQSGGGPFDLLENLGEEFSRQFPNVTFEYQKDSFDNLLINGPRLLASDNPPDVVLLPQLVDPATEGLIASLDGYFEQFGWEDFSPSQLAQNRVNDEGVRGSGALYGLGSGYNITGVFFNKELADQIGMDTSPATLDELESLMATAKDNGILPVISASPATFAHQAIHNQHVDPADIASFIFLAPGSTIDTTESIAAARRLERWATEGYFNEDVNSLDYVAQMSRFIDGEALFMFNGSWEGANLDESMGDKVGFFLVPPLEAGDPPVAMGGTVPVVIPAGASYPDVAAFFFDWIHTNAAARQEVADTTGMSPGGPAGLPLPESEPGSLRERMQEQAAFLAAEGVIVDFLGTATAGFFSNSLIPEVQRLVGGQTNPEDFVRALQEGYEASIDQ